LPLRIGQPEKQGRGYGDLRTIRKRQEHDSVELKQLDLLATAQSAPASLLGELALL
jgi:hypothetical protein